ncbi:MAG: signal peptide peptidase SppA [candidate division Zixibacteria bacterium]|nr:signal peptide peptidase SppA [candidate division Zixibacteria bacterium]
MFKSLKLFCAFLIFLFSSTSMAANPSPTEGFFLPYNSAATSDDALSLKFNPAGLGWNRGFQGYFLHTYSDSSFKGDYALLLSTHGLGFSAEWLGNVDKPTYRKYSLGTGFKLVDGFYLGTVYSWFGSKDKDYHGLKSWNAGFLIRPFSFISLGGIAKDLNRPVFQDVKTNISFDLGLALRPLSDRITFSIDGMMDEKEKLKDARARYQVSVEPLDGLLLAGDIDNKGNYGINLRVNFPFSGLGSYNAIDKNSKYQKGVVYWNFASERYRTFWQRKDNFLELKLSGNIDEEKSFSLFSGRKVTLLDIIQDIEKAKKDERVKGMIVRLDGLDAGLAKIQELREAFLDFRQNGKKVIFFMEQGGNKEYYLASSGDKIVMLPTGYLSLTGISAEITFIKKTLEKLGIEADLVHIGDYKSASDLVTRDSMSQAHREMVNWLLDDLFEQMTREIAIQRGISQEDLKSIIDQGPFTAKEAKEKGLIDDLAFSDQLDDIVKNMTGKKPHKIGFRRYAKEENYKYTWEIPQRIAVIFATGLINSGESSNNFFLGKMMGSETIARAIKRAREDNSIKAIVFRIDSRGGSGIASDVIWREIILCKGKKPFIVSMSDVAASGGYFIACPGDTIIADPGTITGSIGVISGKFNLKGLYQKIGFTNQTLKRGKHSDFFTSTRGFTEEERGIVKKQTKEFYDDFVDKVAQGRKRSFDDIDKIGRGRVWTGNQAKANGLVDELGGLKQAIEIARIKAGIKEGSLVEIVSLPKRWGFLGFNFEETFSFLGSKKILNDIDRLEEMSQEKIFYVSPYDIEIK